MNQLFGEKMAANGFDYFTIWPLEGLTGGVLWDSMRPIRRVVVRGNLVAVLAAKAAVILSEQSSKN